MNRNYPHFAIPEIYGETLSYYEVLRKLVKAMNVMIENYDTIPDQIAEAVTNLDASQLFSAVLNQLIHSIATDNTKSANAVKVYKKHDLLYATFNENVNLYESLIDFSTGTETELIIGTNIREVNISELFIELRTLIDDEMKERKQAINTEKSARENADNDLQQAINTEKSARENADIALNEKIDNSKLKIELLWSNENPSLAFEPKAVSVNLSNYKGVFVVSCRDTHDTNVRHADFLPINSVGGRTMVPSTPLVLRVEIEVSETYIYFAEAYEGSEQKNSVCIPFQIYGIR